MDVQDTQTDEALSIFNIRQICGGKGSTWVWNMLRQPDAPALRYFGPRDPFVLKSELLAWLRSRPTKQREAA